MCPRENIITQLNFPKTIDESSDQADDTPRLIASELTNIISPDEYGELYLAAHGYKIEESKSLQQIPLSRVELLRNSVNSKLLATGRLARFVAVATSIDIGFLPDPANQRDEGMPTSSVNCDPELFKLICNGMSRDKIATRLGWPTSKVLRAKESLFEDLNARNGSQLVWRGYQIGLLRPSADEIVLPDQYIDKLHSLETALDGPILPLERSQTGIVETRNRGHQRYEEVILSLLNAPEFAMYHPKLGAYYREKYGYTTTQWRNIISNLGKYGITELKKNPNDVRVAHGIELNIRGLLANRSKPFITEQVLEVCKQRLKEEIGVEEFRLDTMHLGFTLTPELESALPPQLRVAIGLSNPAMSAGFMNMSDLIRTLSTFTGHAAKELKSTVSTLSQNGWLEFTKSNGYIRGALSKEGLRFLGLGIIEVEKEVQSYRTWGLQRTQ